MAACCARPVLFASVRLPAGRELAPIHVDCGLGAERSAMTAQRLIVCAVTRSPCKQGMVLGSTTLGQGQRPPRSQQCGVPEHFCAGTSRPPACTQGLMQA